MDAASVEVGAGIDFTHDKKHSMRASRNARGRQRTQRGEKVTPINQASRYVHARARATDENMARLTVPPSTTASSCCGIALVIRPAILALNWHDDNQHCDDGTPRTTSHDITTSANNHITPFLRRRCLSECPSAQLVQYTNGQ